MKKHAKIGMAVVGFLAVTGFSMAEVREYLQVARNRVATTVRGEIPFSIEIDRMEVLLKKLNAQVHDQKYAVAKSRVALQDAEAEYQRSQGQCANLVSEMQQLRQLGSAETTSSCGTVTVGCRKVSRDDVHRALAYKLTSWKNASATAKAREEALQHQRAAFAKLEQQFGDWQSQRTLLSQRLETLKARNQTQQLASETDTTVFNNADLARATELADQIERELRIVEAQQALGNDIADSLLGNGNIDGQATNVEAEVDRLLENQLTSN
jgi:predicted XRE-type DNA-binding protein